MAHPKRRQVLAGLLATGLAPKGSWADAGAPAYLSAAEAQDGTYALCGIRSDLGIAFQIPLPGRGHAAAAHPHRPEAVGFARRPGTFAFVVDCRFGDIKSRLQAPVGRHFYGHGAFSDDGALLFTTENDFEAGQGRIGVWDARKGYKRVGEFSSGGVGPHDIKRLPGTDILVVANGGIDTHPQTGRTKLNIATMRPNLAYIDGGEVADMVELGQDQRKNSIRHLAVARSGMVGFGLQWQGDGPPAALVGLHRRGQAPTLMHAAPAQVRALNGYVGSIAFSQPEDRLAVTSPRGNTAQVFDAGTGKMQGQFAISDAGGVAAAMGGFVVSTGTGVLRSPNADRRVRHALAWDNHLVPVGPSSLV